MPMLEELVFATVTLGRSAALLWWRTVAATLVWWSQLTRLVTCSEQSMMETHLPATSEVLVPSPVPGQMATSCLTSGEHLAESLGLNAQSNKSNISSAPAQLSVCTMSQHPPQPILCQETQCCQDKTFLWMINVARTEEPEPATMTTGSALNCSATPTTTQDAMHSDLLLRAQSVETTKCVSMENVSVRKQLVNHVLNLTTPITLWKSKLMMTKMKI